MSDVSSVADEIEKEADTQEAENEEKLPDNPLVQEMIPECLSLLCKIGSGLSHAYVRLDIHDRDITDIELLKNFIHVRYVDISGNFLRDITPLNHLTNMLTLKADKNNLTSAKLEPLPFLQVANFASNKITSTEGVEHPLLEHLNFNTNQISDVSGLHPGILTNLHTLELRGNKLETTAGIYLPNLKNLYLAANVIKTIEGLDRLEKLTMLHLRDNQISTLDGFSEQMKSLQYINLRGNNISTLKELKKLVCLPLLRAIVLTDNPCQEEDSYRVEVLIHLRRLERLDKDEYSGEERTDAEEIYEQRRQDELMKQGNGEEGEDVIEDQYFSNRRQYFATVLEKSKATQQNYIFSKSDQILRSANLREDKVDTHALAVTGPSRNEGKYSPRYSAGNSSPILGKSSGQQPWVPSIRLQRDATSSLDRNEITFRTVRSILNKLTPENFSKLSISLLNVGISSKIILKGIVILIFDKSIDEPRYSTLYANLCYRLYHEAPNFDPPPSQPLNGPYQSTPRPNTFRRLLIAKLQDEFENRNKKLEAFDSKVGPLDADEEEQRILSKRHMLGNIKFIGELYRLGVLHESIMHKCIKQLISKKKKGTMEDLIEDLECLTQIMTTCGKRLDHPKAKCLMDQYFGRMEVLPKKQPDLPSRIRFMLQDVVELRRNNWIPRRAQRDNGPRTLSQIRQEVEEMYPSNPHHRDDYRSNHGRSPPFSPGRLRKEFQATRSDIDHSPGRLVKALPPPNIDASGGHHNQSDRSFDFFSSVQTRSGLPSSDGNRPRQHMDRAASPLTNGYKSENKSIPNGGIRATNKYSNDRYSEASYKPSPPAPHSRPHFTKLDSGNLSSNGRQARPHPIDDAVPVQRGWKQPPIRHSPTIGRTNVDAIQAPFQQTSLGKKAVANEHSEKTGKKITMSKSDTREICEELISEFLDSKRSLDETRKLVSGLKMQRKVLLEWISHALFISFSKTNNEKTRVVSLLNCFITKEVIKKEIIAEGVHLMIDGISQKESEITGIKSSVASLIALLLDADLVNLREVADPLTGGVLFPLFLLILKETAKLKGEDRIAKIFQDSDIEMEKMFPEASRKKESMFAILEGKQLLFLFPLAEIESKLTNQISQNASPTSIYKWVKENVTSDLLTDPEFINVLVSCCLEHVTRSSTLSAELSENLTKEMKDKERHLLSEIQPVMRKFLDENHRLQLRALYTAQVFCHNKGFPKGLLLRLFNSMYEDDIVDEEVFFLWKEEVNDSYPGKGKALFQVNTWLKWLHEAETDDDNDDD